MPLDQPPTPIEQRGHDVRMSFGEHLEELRSCLIRSLIGLALVCVGTLYFGRTIISILLVPLAQVQASLGLPTQAYVFSPAAGFGVYLKVSLVSALIIAFPWIAYQLWRFVRSGLYAYEQKAIIIVAPFSALMSLLAVLFLYYVLLPICLAFFLFFNAGFPPAATEFAETETLMQKLSALTVKASGYGGAELPGEQSAKIEATDTPAAALPMLLVDPAEPNPGEVWIKLPEHELRASIGGQTYRFLPYRVGSAIQSMLGLSEYIGLVTLLAIGVVLAFQTPVVMLILGWSGFVDPHWLGRYRKYTVFICFALGALLTPTDPISMFVMALPLWGLYELGLMLMKFVYKKPGLTD